MYWQFREKYGDVFTVYLGSRPVVVLCGTDAIREALVDQAEAFAGRGKIAVVDPIFQDYGESGCWGRGAQGRWAWGGGEGWGGTESPSTPPQE